MYLNNITKNSSSYLSSPRLNPSLESSESDSNITEKITHVSSSPCSFLQNQPTTNNTLTLSQSENEELHRYKKSCDNVFFNTESAYETKDTYELTSLERTVFPLIINANKQNAICYSTNAQDVVEKMLDSPSGQRQFVYFNGIHAIYVDGFKDQNGNISIITIDPWESDGKHTPDFDLGRAFLDNDKIKDGQLYMLNMQATIQKSNIGCHFFSLALAKQATKDPHLIPLHKLNIEKAKSSTEGSWMRLNAKESEKYLGAAYYKHSHSLTRINDLPLEKREEAISSKGSLLQRHLQFRVSKNIDGENITFSNSIDVFRRKQIEKTLKTLNHD